MNRIASLAACAVAVAIATQAAQAQSMDVIWRNGHVDQFNLAEIDSLTFDQQALGGDSGARPGNDILRIHMLPEIVQYTVTQIDSVCFEDNARMLIHLVTGETDEFNLADVDSLTFASSLEEVVSITYNGATVTVVNPFEGAGVGVQVTGADVIVTSTAAIEGIIYALSGATTDGLFKIYSPNDFALRLDGVQITNLNGPAINIQADETITVKLVDGTTTTLTDGVTYAAPPGGEDQKAAFFSEGQLVFTGSGSLIVHGRGSSQHGLGSDDYVEVHSGSIVIQSAVKDAVHTNEGYFQNGGSVEVVTSGSDGVDAGDGPIEILGGVLTILSEDDDRDALKCAGSLLIAGGAVDLTVEGDQSKGLNAAAIQLTGGTVTIGTSGGVVLEPSGLGYDPSYCTAVKADNLVLLDGCELTITTTGLAGRGVSSDGNVTIQSGSLRVTSSGGGGTYTNELGQTDAYHGPCLNADGRIALTGGTVTLSHSGSAGKGIAGDSNFTVGAAASSPTLQITTTGARIYIGNGEYAEAKAVSVDSVVTIVDGALTISSADDAIKSKHWIDVNGGLINVTNSVEGLEGPNIYINGGEMHITSTNDCLNATYGLGGEQNDGSILTISGGYVHLNAPAGDGIDSNGNLTLAGGTVVVHGPPGAPEVGIDVNGTFRVTGSFSVVSQTNSSMLEVPSSSSTQRTVVARSSQTLAAGSLFHIRDTAGNVMVTFRPSRTYSAVLFTCPEFAAGTTYQIYTGGTYTGGVERDGVCTGGTYGGGTLRTSFTFNTIVKVVTF